MSVRGRYATWIAASTIAGLVVVLALGCGGGSFWQGLITLSIPPALFLAPFIRWFGGHGVRWLVLTMVGVFACYATTFAAYFAIGRLLFALGEQGVGEGRYEGWLGTVLFLVVQPGIGGIALGTLQLPALGHDTKWRSWIVATMVGSVAVAPIAFLAVLGAEICGPSQPPWWLIGAAGGLIYGTSTTIALGMRLSTLIARPRS